MCPAYSEQGQESRSSPGTGCTLVGCTEGLHSLPACSEKAFAAGGWVYGESDAEEACSTAGSKAWLVEISSSSSVTLPLAAPGNSRVCVGGVVVCPSRPALGLSLSLTKGCSHGKRPAQLYQDRSDPGFPAPANHPAGLRCVVIGV